MPQFGQATPHYIEPVNPDTLQDCRDANITPLFKNGFRIAPNNYRPVSLTSQVVKIPKRIIYDELMELATKNKTISYDQHGFQDKCSCVTQLFWMPQRLDK